MSKRKRPQPPHSVEAEQSVLGGLMLDNDRWDDVATLISAQDFFISTHRTIYSHMQTLVEQGNPIDLITLSESLEQQEQLEQVGGFAYLAELSKKHAQHRQYHSLRAIHCQLRRAAPVAVTGQ